MVFNTTPLEEELAPYLKKLEKERLILVDKISTRKKIIFFGCLFLLTSLLGYSWMTGLPVELLGITALIGSIIFLVIGLIASNVSTGYMRKAYEQRIKGKIYDKALRHYNSSIEYYPEQYIKQATFKAAKLFGSFNRYQGDDLCVGQLKDGRAFRFSELQVLYRSSNNSSKSGSSQTRTVFKGLFYAIHMASPIGARIKIVPDIAESTFGTVGKFMQGVLNKALSSVALEDSLVRFDEEYPDFERAFKIYSNDETVARQFITPTTIAQIEALQEHVGKNVYLTIDDDRCLAGVSGGEFLQVDINRSLVGPVFMDHLEENVHWALTLLTAISKVGIGSHLASNSVVNPFEEQKTALPNADKWPSSPKKKTAVSYQKTRSKGNPFLL